MPECGKLIYKLLMWYQTKAHHFDVTSKYGRLIFLLVSKFKEKETEANMINCYRKLHALTKLIKKEYDFTILHNGNFDIFLQIKDLDTLNDSILSILEDSSILYQSIKDGSYNRPVKHRKIVIRKNA